MATKEIKPVKERDNLDLLELVCQLHSRALQYPSKEMHDAYVEARKELETRFVPPSPEQDDKDLTKMAMSLTNAFDESPEQDEFDKLQKAFQEQAKVKDEYFLEIERLKAEITDLKILHDYNKKDSKQEIERLKAELLTYII